MANKGRVTPLESPSGRSAASSDAFEPNIEAQMLALLGQNEERKAAKLDKKRDALLKKAEKLKSVYEDECKEAVRAEEARLKMRLEEQQQEAVRILAEGREVERQLVGLLRKASAEVEQASVRVQGEKDKVAEKVDEVTVSFSRLVAAHNDAIDATMTVMWAEEMVAAVKEERVGGEGGLGA